MGNTTITGYTSDDSSDEEISLYNSPTQRIKIQNYASALLQIAQGIDKIFYKPPFGVLKDYKDPVQQLRALHKGASCFDMWSVSLMNSVSYSQLFLHYNILNDAIKWSKSSFNAVCVFCRSRSYADKMLLCDGCNCGKHLFCFKPKLTVIFLFYTLFWLFNFFIFYLQKVPDADWFCEKCKPIEKVATKKKKKTRKIFSVENVSDGDDDNVHSDSSEDRKRHEKKSVVRSEYVFLINYLATTNFLP